jgi:hypothetical protein
MNFGLAALQEVFEHGIREGMSEVLYMKGARLFSFFFFLSSKDARIPRGQRFLPTCKSCPMALPQCWQVRSNGLGKLEGVVRFEQGVNLGTCIVRVKKSAISKVKVRLR